VGIWENKEIDIVLKISSYIFDLQFYSLINYISVDYHIYNMLILYNFITW